MTRRQDNPCLLWLIAEAEFRMAEVARAGLAPTSHAYWRGWRDNLLVIHAVCRWLDAEDEWAAECGFNSPRYKSWVQWRLARMAEAGVL